MSNNKKNFDLLQNEESKQNLSKSNSDNPLTDNSKQIQSLEQADNPPEEMIKLPSGKTFSKKRFNQIKTALGLSGTLRLPSDIIDDGIYEYFWASTQFEGMIEKKQALGYEKCTNKKSEEYRHFASMDGNVRHEHVLMRIKKVDRELISEIQREKKALSEIDRVTKNLDPDAVFENKSRLERDGELTLSENIQNKYNNNKIKQV